MFEGREERSSIRIFEISSSISGLNVSHHYHHDHDHHIRIIRRSWCLKVCFSEKMQCFFLSRICVNMLATCQSIFVIMLVFGEYFIKSFDWCKEVARPCNVSGEIPFLQKMRVMFLGPFIFDRMWSGAENVLNNPTQLKCEHLFAQFLSFFYKKKCGNVNDNIDNSKE